MFFRDKRYDEQIEQLTKKIEKKWMFSREDEDSLVLLSVTSIEEQIDTAQLFFAHHFQQVEHEQALVKELERYQKVFSTYRRTLKKLVSFEVRSAMVESLLDRYSVM
ncbi:hypothetical protein PP175_29500 (plasmid) [Aneurinibacillus sp. Ricciae_BoGa-3]|uniref:hypothetical protein n=1 Tax=Aneurinibacillus sp. Ricciae_BoGa-3 TaxID=3022697 RepID=UPI00234183DF|nr:hypothetical protein [Aneurinibacillus sp. Ricciae_BoGa-3]WCK57328.1 hypothetical protein PP175_29500 [Aneurinibacillus sp. Ricciae_BoGa-3]